jgi:hypothetical protein
LDKKQLKKVEACLSLRGYTPELYVDEFAAYLLENDEEILKISEKESSSLQESFRGCNLVLKPLLVMEVEKPKSVVSKGSKKPTSKRKN